MQKDFTVSPHAISPRARIGFKPSAGFARVRRGITLTELLVVIGILALLAAILFPVFGRVRENSRKSSCQSNLKQVSAAFMQYCQDFNEKLPHSAQNSDPIEGGWVLGGGGAPTYPFPTDVSKGALYPYVKNAQVYICPSDLNGKTKQLSYSMNMICSQKRLSGVYKASECIILVDESKDLDDGNFNPKVCGPPGTNEPTLIHSGGANVGFLDGHAKWKTQEQFEKKDFRFNQLDCP